MNSSTSTFRQERRYLTLLILGFGVAALIWLGLLAGQLGNPHRENLWVEAAYAKKLNAAHSTTTPKVIIISGSSAMFGLDSSALEHYLGVPVVNLGVNAGIQPPWLTYYAKRAINPGDSVIFALEYPLFHFNDRINHVFLNYTLSHPKLLKELDAAVWAQLFWKTSLLRVIQGYTPIPRDFDIGKGLYGPHNLSDKGDQLHNEVENRQVWMTEAVANHPGETYGARFLKQKVDIKPWTDLADRVSENSGCSIFVPPPFLHHPSYDTGVESTYYDTIADHLQKQGLHLSGEPRQFMYPTDQFFDTDYHLTATAREQHTQRIIQLLAGFRTCLHGKG